MGKDMTNNKGKKVADGLKRILADTYILSLKARNYHWNVTGPHFSQLHDFFEDIYKYLDASGDTIAERIRSIGFKSPGSYAEFISVSSIKEETQEIRYDKMLANLLADFRLMVCRSHEVKETAAEEGDDPTVDLMVEHIMELEKFIWMIDSHLDT